jgi:hypothetical protein
MTISLKYLKSGLVRKTDNHLNYYENMPDSACPQSFNSGKDQVFHLKGRADGK